MYCNHLYKPLKLKNMKNLIITSVFFLISLVSFSQVKYPLFKYKMYSDIWTAKVDYIDPKLVLIGSKKGGSFGWDESYIKKIDMKKVQTYLEKSFNDFRNDYNIKSSKLDKNLTNLCIEDAKSFNQNKGIFKNYDKEAKQVWNKIPVFCFSNVDTKSMDINKVIADSFFDYFVGDDKGMDILLDKSNKKYGFGIHYNKEDYGFYLVAKNK